MKGNISTLARASSSSSSTASPDQDSTDDYPEIEGSTFGDPTEEGRLIVMVALARGPLQIMESIQWMAPEGSPLVALA
jgi:hypothetical protein